jgi:hypothetical protein
MTGLAWQTARARATGLAGSFIALALGVALLAAMALTLASTTGAVRQPRWFARTGVVVRPRWRCAGGLPSWRGCRNRPAPCRNREMP